jgi:ribonucleoside-diphosphate reductase alpha chain
MNQFSENAITILKARYFKKSADGELLEKTPEHLFDRVAGHIAAVEKSPAEQKKWKKIFMDMMLNRKFMPNSPTLTGAGRGLCLSACFVLPIEDSLDHIFETVKNAALVHKEGGGTGFDFSRIRPAGSFVKKTQGIASGPLSFLRVIDAGTEAVKQGGTRRGANMGVLRVDHPDIEEFITMKQDGKSAQNFNISVAVTDAFIDALQQKGDYDLIDPMTGKAVASKSAQQIFDKIVDSAWANGDPGLIFIDRINALNPTRIQGPIRATNPCGEQPLHDYESCNLGSINLARFYKEDAPDLFDWADFADIIHKGIRFLDNVIDANIYPLPEIDAMAKGNRRIGLGLMGLADLLIQMKLRYDTVGARDVSSKIIRFMKTEAIKASAALAEERGSFPRIDQSVFAGGKMRNATVLSIAPTGTISRICGCSSSVEPVFAFKTISKILDREIVDIHPLFQDWQGKNPDQPQPDWFISAGEISPLDHILMQEVFQKDVDSAVSKTINFPNQASKEEIAAAYLMAFQKEIKGITVYRDGCRSVQVLNDMNKVHPTPQKRPDALPSTTHKIQTGLGRLYVTISELNNKPFEIFCSIGKSGYSTMADAEAIGRLISMALRSGIPPREVIQQLKGIGGSEQVFHNGNLIQSIPDAVAQVLERHIGETASISKDISQLRCPLCYASLPDEKCPVCPNCGWTRCGGA